MVISPSHIKIEADRGEHNRTSDTMHEQLAQFFIVSSYTHTSDTSRFWSRL